MKSNKVIIYALIAIACIVIIGLSAYFIYFHPASGKRPSSVNEDGEPISEEVRYDNLKDAFNKSFNNQVRRINNELNNINERLDITKDIVYTIYNIEVYAENKYDINVNIPYLNIDSELAQQINTEIDNTFGVKVNDVIQSKEELSTYNIDYVAYVNGDIISLVIKATLKEKDFPQRVIMKTYNYNVANNSLLTFDSLVSLKKLNKSEIQNRINKTIETIIKENEALAQIGYNMFKRNLNDQIYLISSIDSFCIDQNENVYILFPYGNGNFTSEVDLIIL